MTFQWTEKTLLSVCLLWGQSHFFPFLNSQTGFWPVSSNVCFPYVIINLFRWQRYFLVGFWNSRLLRFSTYFCGYKLHPHTGKGNELTAYVSLWITGYPTGSIELLKLQRKMWQWLSIFLIQILMFSLPRWPIIFFYITLFPLNSPTVFLGKIASNARLILSSIKMLKRPSWHLYYPLWENQYFNRLPW